MKFIDDPKNNSLINIQVEVNRKRVWRFGGRVSYSEEHAKSIGVDIINDEKIIKTGLRKGEEKLFTSAIKTLALTNLTAIEKSKIESEVVQNELIYIYNYLKNLSAEQLTSDRPSESDAFLQIVNVMTKIEEIASQDGLKLTIIKRPRVKVNPTIVLPKATDTKKLYEYISQAVYSYFLDTADTFSLQWNLKSGHKEPITPQLLKQKLSSMLSVPIANYYDTVGYRIYEFLPYLITQPGFSPNLKRSNSLITEKQGEFILAFFNLFGLFDSSPTLNLKKGFSSYSTKKLRIILSDFKRKYNR